MSREADSISIAAVDSDEQRSALETLLTEYHTWLATEAREWAAERKATPEGEGTDPLPNDGEYDPAAAAAEDVVTLGDTDAHAQGFLAFHEGAAGGVVLLYGVSAAMAEIKRLYVRPEFRGKGFGRALCRATIDAAGEEGYERIGLTTPPWSEGAHALYEGLGFEYIDPYPETMLPEHLHGEALFMQRSLAP